MTCHPLNRFATCRRCVGRGIGLSLCTGLLLCGAIACGCDRAAAKAGAGQSGPPAAPVHIATAVQEDVPLRVQAIGWVESFTSVTIKPQIEGQLKEIHFKEGQEVKAGDLLFTIDPRPFHAAFEAVEATLARDEAMSRDAQLEYDREVDLFSRQIAAERERDAAKAAAEAKAAQVRADQADVDTAKLRLGYCSITSPSNARAGSYLAHRGTIVKANETELVVLNALDPIYVTFSVAEQYLSHIKEQMAKGDLAVEASFADSKEQPKHGVLSFIDNQVDKTTGMIRLKATFNNDDRRLWPGRYVNVALTVTKLNGAVVLPSAALQVGQDGQFVFVVKADNTVEMRPVQIGVALDERTVITAGLKAGEVIVTDGQLRLVPGSKIQALASDKSAAASATSAPNVPQGSVR